MLREASSTSRFILDLLDFVEVHLLQPDSTVRASCSAIVDRFSVIQEQCVRAPGYCIPRQHTEILRAPTDMSQKTSVSLSSEMRKDYQMNMKPSARAPPSPKFGTSRLGQATLRLTRLALPTEATTLLAPPEKYASSQFRHSTGHLQDIGNTRPLDRYPSLNADDGRIDTITEQARDSSTRIYRRVSMRARAVKDKFFGANGRT
jgi:hypothetical protein